MNDTVEAPPVDNDHVAEGATPFEVSETTIRPLEELPPAGDPIEVPVETSSEYLDAALRDAHKALMEVYEAIKANKVVKGADEFAIKELTAAKNKLVEGFRDLLRHL